MRFKNIIKKENIKYEPGDVLVVCNESKEGAFMVFRNYGMYNLMDLNEGRIYFSNNKHYDEFAKKVGQIFTSAEVISNHQLELGRVED